MGNRKFKLSEMIPNAWFYKLKEMGTRNHHKHQLSKKNNPSPPPPPPPQTESLFSLPIKPHQNSVSQLRKSYYFSRELDPKQTPKSPDLVDPPRKSSKKRRPNTTTTKKKPTSCSTSNSTTTKCTSSSSSPSDETCIVIDVDGKSLEDSVSGPLLPPIRTERKKFNDSVKVINGTQESIDESVMLKKSSVKCRETAANESFSREESIASPVFREQGHRPARRFPTGSPRVRIRINSPRLAKRTQIKTNSGRRSMSTSLSRKSISSDSLAVVKSSFDPQKDFRDSMVEMIVENNIRAAKDLEELLACYLSLNSDEYHGVIIQVFRQIWFDLNSRKEK